MKKIVFWSMVVTILCTFFAVKSAIADDYSGTTVSGDTLQSGTCQTLSLSGIPVGNFNSWQFPEAVLKITQGYATEKKNGFCIVNGSQYEATDSKCQSQTIYYGHTGIDLHEPGSKAGTVPVLAVQNGTVILSVDQDYAEGWGETIVLATRTNLFSEEILTFAFHHLDNKNFVSSRKYNACDTVKSGQVIAYEGGSGGWPTHLHFGVRRWPNINALKSALNSHGSYDLLGQGYVYDKQDQLKNYLDPQALLLNYFKDFQPTPNADMANSWAYPYINAMRLNGIDFGQYDGRFGGINLVTRREASRWIKIATKLESVYPQNPTFNIDMDSSDPDYPYVEALTRFPKKIPVIDPHHTCQLLIKKFCPDDNLTRAAALKMVVLAFYSESFVSFYDSWFIRVSQELWDTINNTYKDVDLLSWYGPYVIFGNVFHLVSQNEKFRPNDPITRAEFSKWLMEGYWHQQITADLPSACGQTPCPVGYYCDPGPNKCTPYPVCIPSESQVCAVGGSGTVSTCSCKAGEYETQPCDDGGTKGRLCNTSCQWDTWSSCQNTAGCTPNETSSCGNCGYMVCLANNTWSDCKNVGECSPASQESQLCNGLGIQLRTCQSDCSWGSWETCPAPDPSLKVCEIGQSQTQNCILGTAKGIQTRYCSSTYQWNEWSACELVAECQVGAVEDESCTAGSITGLHSRQCLYPGKWGGWSNCYQMTLCSPGQTQKQDCTNSGYQTRSCNQEGQWDEWSSCITIDQCTSGQTDTKACNGGSQIRTCQANGTWGDWSNECIPEPSGCSYGAVESQTCSGGTMTRTCLLGGVWSTWGDCIQTQECTPGEQDAQSCASGQQIRTCDPTGHWGNWGECTSQSSCPVGEVQSQNCAGGTMSRTCNSSGTWDNWGDCIQTMECTPGEEEVLTCQNGTQTHVCGLDGKWGTPTECQPTIKTCTQGQVETETCSGGTRTHICDQSGNWGPWSECQKTCKCSTGACCDGCNYYTVGTVCAQDYVYQCQGSQKGQDSQRAIVRTQCSGSSPNCDGQRVQYGWDTLEDCSTSQVCQMQNGYPKCVGSCQDTYVADSSQACNSNSSSSGSPTLCLQIKKVSGSTFQYRVCKSNSTFSSTYTYQLVDENNSVFFDTYTGSQGSSCSDWKQFQVQYIKSNGSFNGAGLSARISSPKGCTANACQYRTGTITISKTCQ